MQEGDGASCSILGFMYEKGKGVVEDARRSLEFYELGCKRRNLDGCTGMGFLYSNGQGVPADKDKAASLFREACEKGNGRACSGIGHQLRVSNDPNAAVPWMDRGCKLGYVRACFYAGALLTKANKELPRAYGSYERACLGRDLRASLAQAGMLATGSGTGVDTPGALALRDRTVKELQRGCDARDAEACEALGDHYSGVYHKSVKAPEKALPAYSVACSMGANDVCMDAAKLLEKGIAPYVPPDAKSARALREVACARGLAEACAKLGKKPPKR